MSDLALVLGLLVAVVAVVTLAGRLQIAYPILLVVVGGALALVPGLPEVTLDPQLILVLFLPPLVYSTSLGTSPFELRAHRRPILALAVGLVLLTMGAVAAVARLLIPGMSWPVALVLGAIVAPPDPIAASEVAGKVGLPSGLVSVLEGEGLINDGTALTAYQLSLAAVGGTVTLASIGEAAARSVIFGIGIGLAAGILATRVLRLVDDPLLENTVLLMLPFAAYLPANSVGGSGVLAVLAAGLWYLRDGRPVLSATGRLQQRSLWQLVAFLLSGLSFLLVGLQLRDVAHHASSGTTGIPGGTGRAVATIAALCLTVVVIRFVGVFGFAALPGGRTRLRRDRGGTGQDADAPAPPMVSPDPAGPAGPGDPAGPADPARPAVAASPGATRPRPRADRGARASWRSITVISWAGMRGAVSLAAALAIPDDVPYRDLVIAVTFAVIVVTLVGQGLTLPFLVRRLNVVSPDREAEFDLLRARQRLTVTALQTLRDLDRAGPADAGDADDVDPSDDPGAEALARVSALYQNQLDRIERRLTDFAEEPTGGDGTDEPDGSDGRDGAGTAGDLAAAAEREDAVRAAFRTQIESVREAQRVELERLEIRGAVDHRTADRLRSRLDAAELSVPAVPHA